MKNYPEIPHNTPFQIVMLVDKDLSAVSYSSKTEFFEDISLITADNPDGTYTTVKEWAALYTGLKYLAFVSKPHHFEGVCNDLKCREALTKLIRDLDPL